MLTIEIDDALAERLRALAEASGMDLNRFAVAAVTEAVERREREAMQFAAARAEAQAILHGPRHPFDPDAEYRKYQEKYGLPDLSEVSAEELADQADAILANMAPEMRKAMEKQGLL